MEALIFAPLSWVYQIISGFCRLLKTKHRLPFPVLSVGNIAMGGRAKTPLVILICEKLKSMGFEPVVLTRGYGRKLKSPVLWDGGISDASLMGDEATEIARSGFAFAVLVGADRFANAKKFLANQKVPQKFVFVLDKSILP